MKYTKVWYWHDHLSRPIEIKVKTCNIPFIWEAIGDEFYGANSKSEYLMGVPYVHMETCFHSEKECIIGHLESLVR